jgi:hypothetical protein
MDDGLGALYVALLLPAKKRCVVQYNFDETYGGKAESWRPRAGSVSRVLIKN